MSNFRELARGASNYLLIIVLIVAAGIAVYSLFSDVTGSGLNTTDEQQHSEG